jgi:AraC-type transcriptional regulator N-terminus
VPLRKKEVKINFMNQSEENRDRAELVKQVTKILPEDGVLEPIPGFALARLSKPTEARAIYTPAFCFVIQGRKQVFLGEEVFRYDPGNYLIFTVDLPLVFKVEEASAEKPYLGIRLNLDPSLVASVMMDAGFASKKSGANVKAINVNAINFDLLNAVVRLVRLLQTPNDLKVLSQLVIKEIVYRLLQSGQDTRLSHLIGSAKETHRISKAIGHLRENYDQPLRVEDIAREFGMSVSGFHHHFKTNSASGSPPFDARQRFRRRQRRFPRRLRRPRIFQPRLQKTLWCPTKA